MIKKCNTNSFIFDKSGEEIGKFGEPNIVNLSTIKRIQKGCKL